MTLRDKYNEHSLKIEFLYSVIITYSLIQIWLCLGSPAIPGVDIFLFANLAQIEATLLGFILTTLGIIFTRLRDDPFKKIHRHPDFDDLWSVFISAMLYLGLGVLMAWSARLFGLHPLLIVLILWTAIISAIRIARCVWVLKQVIYYTLHPPEQIKSTT